MKVLTYLGFTLLSILMQFCVMDLIQEKMNHSEKAIDLNTSQKIAHNVLKNLSSKPLALYYKKNYEPPAKLLDASETYSNQSITESFLITTTEISSSVIDVFYDENATATEYTSTETISTTDIDNVTEITLFEKANTTVKPKPVPKKNATLLSNDCYCNLLFKVCDINCCCDFDCSEAEKKLFNCSKDFTKVDINQELCLLTQPFKPDHSNTIDFIENLFCVAKTNLPEERKVHLERGDANFINKVYRWKHNFGNKQLFKFTKKAYHPYDPIWVYQNGSISYIDLPAKTVNNYCTSRKPLLFLQDETIKCNVKFEDLEMFRAYKLALETKVITVTNATQNSTALNCSSVACTNWTIIICNDDTCDMYNKSLHEPLCSHTTCTNIAQRIDYTFFYHNRTFVNATIKFYIKTVSPTVQLLAQEVNVKFILGNRSEDNIIALSGNPGYIKGLPIIISNQKENHTENFFNTTTKLHYMPFLRNSRGLCINSNVSQDFVLFGVNRRRKCRLELENINAKKNATDICKEIQNSIDVMLGLKKSSFVAPIGNPYGLKDQKWLSIKKELNEDQIPIYGQNNGNAMLTCYNLIIEISYIFLFKDSSEKPSKKVNTILAVWAQEISKNVSLQVDDLSLILTFNTMFIDNMKPPDTEFAGSPHLNIHLPKDFFFPFPSNNYSYGLRVNICLQLFMLMFILSKN